MTAAFSPSRLRRLLAGLLPARRADNEDAALPEGTRVNLGCGAEPLEGYVNIDAHPEAKADLRLDFRELDRAFAPGTLSEAVMIHSLAYLNLWQARSLFKSLYALFAPGARLVIETPDLEKCARRVLSAGEGARAEELLEGVRGLFAFGRDHLRESRDYVPYAFSWAGWHLKQELEEAGFVDVRILEPRTHVAWRDLRIEARKPR
jgi:hypothetical protein